MASTVVATLAGISNKGTTASKLGPTSQKLIAAYVSSGKPVTTDVAHYVSFITKNPGLSVQELITKIEPKADRKARQIHMTRIHKMLRSTSEGRHLVASGLVALVPLGGRPYWYMDVERLIGAEDAKLIVSVRNPSVQKPKMVFGKDIGAKLRDNTRASVSDWCDLAGVGRRWLSQAGVAAAQQNAKVAVVQVARENNLAIALAAAISTTTKPMITAMVRDIMATTPTARAAA